MKLLLRFVLEKEQLVFENTTNLHDWIGPNLTSSRKPVPVKDQELLSHNPGDMHTNADESKYRQNKEVQESTGRSSQQQWFTKLLTVERIA